MFFVIFIKNGKNSQYFYNILEKKSDFPPDSLPWYGLLLLFEISQSLLPGFVSVLSARRVEGYAEHYALCEVAYRVS